MEKENCFCRTEIVTRGNGGLVLCMEEVYITGKMAKGTKDSIKMEKSMVVVNITMKIIRYMRDNGVMGHKKEKEGCLKDLMR